MNKSLVATGLALLGVILGLSIPRLTALDRFVTPDEPKWLMRSANFYNALNNFDLEKTYQHTHPGITITWAGMAGFLRRYPLYVDVRSGQIERDEKLFIFLRNHQISPMSILVAGRFFMVLFIVLTVSLAFLVGSRLLGVASAFIGFILIAFDPFFTALSRLLHVDGLVSALMLLSVLSYLAYLYDGHRKYYLLISGVSAGLSWLTKSPAFFLLPFIGWMALMELFFKRGSRNPAQGCPIRSIAKETWQTLAPTFSWLAIACATFILLLPAMWVDPLSILKSIFSQALTYALAGHENITYFNKQLYAVGDSAWYFYPISFLWRTSPVTLIGIAFAVLGLIFRHKLGISTRMKRVVFYLIAYAILFGVVISLGQKKFDRYLLPSHLALDLIAGFGWVTLAETISSVLKGKLSDRFRRLGLIALYSGLVVWQLSGILQTYPYYLTYYNPWLGGSSKADQVMMVGWGEGLDQVASYLNKLPSAEKLRVVAWYGDGSLSYLFKGHTISMEVDMTLAELRKADYVVLYINQLARQLPSQDILRYFERLTPVNVVSIGGVEYAWVYDMKEVARRSLDINSTTPYNPQAR